MFGHFSLFCPEMSSPTVPGVFPHFGQRLLRGGLLDCGTVTPPASDQTKSLKEMREWDHQTGFVLHKVNFELLMIGG